MAKKYKIEIYKCYDVQVLDEDGNMVDFHNEGFIAQEYVYGDKKQAIKIGKMLKELVMKHDNEQ